MKRFAALWQIPFVAGVGFFIIAVALADVSAVPLVVLAFNAGLWLAQWFSDLQRAQLLEALALTREMCRQQAALIEALKQEQK